MLRTTKPTIGRKSSSYIALAFGLILTIPLLATLSSAASEEPAASPVAGEIDVTYDTMIEDSDEGLAELGQIFIGTVIGVAGRDRVGTSDPEDFLEIIIYEVQVESTLKGNATGVVRVWYEGADDRGPDSEGARRLRDGERIMFFAGYNPEEDRYPVSAGLGVIPIENERQSDELIATFEPLIQQAEQAERRERRAAVADPCEQPNEAASIAAEPGRGRAGDRIRLTGGPFARPEVAIWLDGRDALLTAAEVATDCTIDTTVRIPRTEPGRHRIVVRDGLGRSAEISIEVIGR